MDTHIPADSKFEPGIDYGGSIMDTHILSDSKFNNGAVI
jgi:hypothetical protein